MITVKGITLNVHAVEVSIVLTVILIFLHSIGHYQAQMETISLILRSQELITNITTIAVDTITSALIRLLRLLRKTLQRVEPLKEQEKDHSVDNTFL